MQVWALRNPSGSFRGKFHRHDSYDCAGRRMYEESYPDQEDYVLVDILNLPPRHGACQFECCFRGLPDAAAVACRYGAILGGPPAPARAARPVPAKGLRIGQRVTYREVHAGKTHTWTIVSGAPDRATREISATSPIASALLGSNAGDRLTIARPTGPLEIEVLAVDDT
jgi:hypothetical protein